MWQLRGLDLNLLLALDALLEERHVTRAAERLGLSQPAVSNALGRLRDVFGDDLLVRGRAGMEPTPRALELAAPVRRLLRQAERLLESEAGFDPALCRRHFTVRMSDLLGHLVLPACIARIAAEAPSVAIDILHLPPAATLDALERDELDLALSMGLAHGASIRAQPLLPDHMVCVLRKGHPAAARLLTGERFLALRHVRVAISPTDSRFVDDVLAAEGKRRQVAMTLPHWLVVPEVLRATDLAAVMSSRLARAFVDRPGSGLVLRDVPFASSCFDWTLYWHARHDSNAAHAWLRRLVAEVVSPGGRAAPPAAAARRRRGG